MSNADLKADLSSTGDVSGPASSTDGNIATFDGTNGKTIQDSGFAPGDFLQVANDLDDLNDAATARSNLGLGTMAEQNANNVNITGGSISGVAGIGGAWELIGTATASNSAAVEFTGLSSSYFMYMVVIDQLVPANDDVGLWMRTSTNGGSSYDSGSTDYAWSMFMLAADGSPSPNPQGDDSDSEISVCGFIPGIGNAANESCMVIVNIFNPSGAGFTKIVGQGTFEEDGGDQVMVNSAGIRLSAADVDAIQFLMSAGNIASGTFKLYGLVAS